MIFSQAIYPSPPLLSCMYPASNSRSLVDPFLPVLYTVAYFLGSAVHLADRNVNKFTNYSTVYSR